MENSQPRRVVRPVDIPIYGATTVVNSEKISTEENSQVYSSLLSGIGTIRHALQDGWTQLKDVRDSTKEIYQTGIAHSEAFKEMISNDKLQASMEMLHQPDNLHLRAGVIAGGGLLGLLFGMTRGGFFKRLFYLTSGTGGAASLCYPHEAREIANVAYEEGHKLSMIAYHFATGVDESPKIGQMILSEEDKKVLNNDKVNEKS